MSLDAAVRLSEMLMGFAFLQQSLEHLVAPWEERRLFIPRIVLAALLIIGVAPLIVEALLLLLSVAILHRFQGPYNGGSDRMSLLLLICLFLSHLAPARLWQELALGYLAVQLVLSYAMAGWLKLVNPDWRSGRALTDVLQFSVYPVSDDIRAWSVSPALMTSLSWALILFELLFPLTLVDGTALKVGLAAAASFHFTTACLFGLNRFLWIWLAAYPLLLWFQQRVIQSAGY
jgi:hypothetical protein